MLDRETYLPVAELALKGTIANILPNGEVDNVSWGTPMGLDLDFYRNVRKTSMPYGQALTIAALVEWQRTVAL